jgi:hypothetical protein
MNNIPAYKTKLAATEENRLLFLFESIGARTIVKAVEYSPILDLLDKKIYNLGFGDFDEENSEINDGINSNNGDMRMVFSTVLNTVPIFFKENPTAGIWVQGSDQGADFEITCRLSCIKSCKNICKNLSRRIKAYQYYVIETLLNYAKNINSLVLM